MDRFGDRPRHRPTVSYLTSGPAPFWRVINTLQVAQRLPVPPNTTRTAGGDVTPSNATGPRPRVKSPMVSEKAPYPFKNEMTIHRLQVIHLMHPYFFSRRVKSGSAMTIFGDEKYFF